MAKYKKINEGIIDKFIDKIFAKTAKKMQSKAIAKLSKEDPDFAKNYKELQKLRDKMEKDLKKKGMTIAQRAAQIAREDINEQDETPSAFKKKKKIKYKDESGKTKETSLASALKDKKHPAHQRAQKIMKQQQVAYKKQKASKEKEHDKERSRQDKATKDAMKDVGKDLDVISKFFTRP